MTNYLLDTNIISYLRDRNTPKSTAIFSHFAGLRDSDRLLVSILSLYEHRTSVTAAPLDLQESLRSWQDEIIELFEVVELPESGIEHYGEMQAMFMNYYGIAKYDGIKKYTVDFMLAATAKAHGCTLVSNDRFFARLSAADPQLRCENWVL